MATEATSGQFNVLNMKVYISGQKKFGEEVLRLCLRLKIEVVGVCCPPSDKYIGRLAKINNIPITPAGTLRAGQMPTCDLGITAHSFDFVGRGERYKPRLGWIGYHPSLLPRHRGKSSIEWAIRFGDYITGGTIFWLNSGVDRGDIAYQDWCWIPPKLRLLPPKKAARILWSEQLLPIGLGLFERALKDIQNGIIVKIKQDESVSTFEPEINGATIFRPDLLMLPERCD